MSQFPLFETIAIKNGEIQQLHYHQARMDQAFLAYFNQSPRFNLVNLIQVPNEFKQGLVRCRIDYNAEDFEIHFYPYTPRKIEGFKCVYTKNLDYQFKYTDRAIFSQLKQDEREILIINNGKVSDCSIGNLLFLKSGKWFSPADYLLKGTQLSYLCDQQSIILKSISVDELFSYEKIMMINALNPFDESRAIAINQIEK